MIIPVDLSTYSSKMEFINRYFRGLLFSKVDDRDGFTIYGACIASGLGGGRKRYILLYVRHDVSHYSDGAVRIDDVTWTCLQTRELQGSYKLKPQSWIMPASAEDCMFEITSRTIGESVFKSEQLPSVNLSMVHDPRKRSKYQYHNRMLLKAMLTMFKAVITIVPPMQYSPINQVVGDVDYELI